MTITLITLSKRLQGDFINWTPKFKEENCKSWKTPSNHSHNCIAIEQWNNKWDKESTLFLHKEHIKH